MNAPEVVARCAGALSASQARCAARAARCTLGAERCSSNELGLGGEKKLSRHLTKNRLLPSCPMNPKDLLGDLDRRSCTCAWRDRSGWSYPPENLAGAWTKRLS